MGQKFVILPDPIQVSNYRLQVVGLPPLTPTSIGGLERELDSADLPDNTTVSGGRTKAGEFEMKIPLHHAVEVAAMRTWFAEGQDPITPTYKKVGTLTIESGSKLNLMTVTIVGLRPTKLALPDLEMKNEGEMAELTCSMKYDDLPTF